MLAIPERGILLSDAGAKGIEDIQVRIDTRRLGNVSDAAVVADYNDVSVVSDAEFIGCYFWLPNVILRPLPVCRTRVLARCCAARTRYLYDV